MKDTQDNYLEIFTELENRWMNAWKNKDEKVVREILADDFTLTSSLSTGELMTKEQWISALPYYNCTKFEFKEIKVRVHGNTAILNIWFNQEANANGKEWDGLFLITDIWVRQQSGNWQVIARHASWMNHSK